MAYKIIHTPLAEKSYLQNISYLEKDWTHKEIKRFIKKTLDVVLILKVDPYVFHKWDYDRNIRKVILIKQITLFYEIENHNVCLLLFWNNYRDPNKIMTLLN
jgi:hypothetical protein